MCLLELKIIFFFNRGPYFSLTIADIITKAALSTHVFKTLSVGPAGVELMTSRMTTRCSINWGTRTRFSLCKSQVVAHFTEGGFCDQHGILHFSVEDEEEHESLAAQVESQRVGSTLGNGKRFWKYSFSHEIYSTFRSVCW